MKEQGDTGRLQYRNTVSIQQCTAIEQCTIEQCRTIVQLKAVLLRAVQTYVQQHSLLPYPRLSQTPVPVTQSTHFNFESHILRP